MKQRIITAIIALLIFVPALVIGKIPFNILVILMGFVAMSEFLRMKKKLLVSPEAILAFLTISSLLIPVSWWNFLPFDATKLGRFYFFVMLLLVYTVFSKNQVSFDDIGVFVVGALYSGLGFSYLIEARQNSLEMVFYALMIVWVTDSGAYLIGRKIGKTKLAPHISPNKTWEGFIGGSLSALLLVGIYIFFTPQIHVYDFKMMLFLTLILSVAGQIGDLVESAFKRYYGIKDSGNILPGHGGILDRFDSLMFVLPLMHFVGLF